MAADTCPPTPDAGDVSVQDLPAARRTFRLLGAALAARGLAIHPPPPEPTSCCGRGCHGCVWEGWFAAARYWRDTALATLDPADRREGARPVGG